MTWRDRMAPARFRGVEFHVETAEMAGGRRTVQHEYPLRDEPYSEDMGRKARSFPVEGYVLGDDYLTKKDALIAALETEGPGELVHPYYGTRRVACPSFRVRETSKDGGIATFSITFDETPAQPVAPTSVVDSTSRVLSSAATVRSSIGAEFLRRYDPGTLTASAEDAIRALTLSVDNAAALKSMTEAEAAAFRVRVDRLEASVESVVNDAAEALEKISGLFDGLTGLDSALAAYALDPGLRPPATTTTREQERENWDALVSLTRVLAVVRSAELVLEVTFDSYDAAVEKRDEIADLLDTEIEEVGDDVYLALEQLRADLVRAVPGADTDLPRLTTYTPAATVPSLVLAHRLYGDVAREADIVARNSVKRPGFCVGGVELEVLSDE